MYASVNEPKKMSPTKIDIKEKQTRDRVQLRASTVRIYSPSKKSKMDKTVVARSINMREVIRRQISGPMGAESSSLELILSAPSEPANFDRLVVKVVSQEDQRSAEILVNIREYVLFSHDMKTKYGADADQYFQPESIDWWSSHIERLLLVKLGKRGKLLMTVSKASIEAILSESYSAVDRSSRGENKPNFPTKIKKAVAYNLKNSSQRTVTSTARNSMGRLGDQMNMNKSGDLSPGISEQRTELVADPNLDANFGENRQIQTLDEGQNDVCGPHHYLSNSPNEGTSTAPSDITASQEADRYQTYEHTAVSRDGSSDAVGNCQMDADHEHFHEQANEHYYVDEFEADESPSGLETRRDEVMAPTETLLKDGGSIQNSKQPEDCISAASSEQNSHEDPPGTVAEKDPLEVKEKEDSSYDYEFETEESVGAHENLIQPENTPSVAEDETRVSSHDQMSNRTDAPRNALSTFDGGLASGDDDNYSAENSYQDEFDDEKSIQSTEVDREVCEILMEILKKIGQ